MSHVLVLADNKLITRQPLQISLPFSLKHTALTVTTKPNSHQDSKHVGAWVRTQAVHNGTAMICTIENVGKQMVLQCPA